MWGTNRCLFFLKDTSFQSDTTVDLNFTRFIIIIGFRFQVSCRLQGCAHSYFEKWGHGTWDLRHLGHGTWDLRHLPCGLLVHVQVARKRLVQSGSTGTSQPFRWPWFQKKLCSRMRLPWLRNLRLRKDWFSLPRTWHRKVPQSMTTIILRDSHFEMSHVAYAYHRISVTEMLFLIKLSFQIIIIINNEQKTKKELNSRTRAFIRKSWIVELELLKTDNRDHTSRAIIAKAGRPSTSTATCKKSTTA
jgi:hypothetical protein